MYAYKNKGIILFVHVVMPYFAVFLNKPQPDNLLFNQIGLFNFQNVFKHPFEFLSLNSTLRVSHTLTH